MKIIEQLNKLPIKSGRYLVLPNLTTPYFIIPLHSRNVFLDAIKLVKPKNRKGLIKKKVLQFIPYFILRLFFPIITIKSKYKVDNSYHLILPWNQDICKKFTIFNFNKSNITLLKIGFGKYRKMIRNEYSSILKVSEFGKSIIPEVVGFSENEDFIKLETIFYNGKHPNYLPESIIDFFEEIKIKSRKVKMIDHPYFKIIIKEIKIALKQENLINLLNIVLKYVKTYENELIPVVLMHADCSKTNVITIKDKKNILIDWEDCVFEGMPIDIGYFNFRMHIDNRKSWKIKNTIDFLVVLHYIYLQIQNNNLSHLEKISWYNSEISI